MASLVKDKQVKKEEVENPQRSGKWSGLVTFSKLELSEYKELRNKYFSTFFHFTDLSINGFLVLDALLNPS